MNSLIRAIAFQVCVCCVAVGVGCAGANKDPEQSGAVGLPKSGPDQTYSPTSTWPKLEGDGVARYIRLHIGADVAETCGLQRSHFEFDSAEPLPQDRNELTAIAECLNRPELKSLPVELVGRADTTGATKYNAELGQKRAERVKAILVSEGIEASRISTASRGEADAVGDEKAVSGYAQGYDRRVDVVLKGVVHAPK